MRAGCGPCVDRLLTVVPLSCHVRHGAARTYQIEREILSGHAVKVHMSHVQQALSALRYAGAALVIMISNVIRLYPVKLMT